jgi:hypothetical protein
MRGSVSRWGWSSALAAFKFSGVVSCSSLATCHSPLALRLRTPDCGLFFSSLIASHLSLLLNNLLSFHQYNGKTGVSSFLFINIMERSISDIFPPFVFNNIMEDTFIFSPRVFLLPYRQELTKCIMFNDIETGDIFAVYC